jgi:hypothetical protein
MGRQLGLVTIDPVFIDWHERQVRAHGLEQRVTGVRAIHADLAGFMRAFTDDASYARGRADFVEQVRPLVAAGAEVIIPAGGLPMLLFARERPFIIDGALVLNGIAVVAKAERWRLRYAASPARWSAAAVLTPRHRRHAWRSTSQGAGESADKRKIGERGTSRDMGTTRCGRSDSPPSTRPTTCRSTPRIAPKST